MGTRMKIASRDRAMTDTDTQARTITKEEIEGIALLEHYAKDPDGEEILRRFADSIQVANRFERKQWVPTARKLKGWTVNLRTGQIYALTLKRDEVQVLLLPEMLGDEERKALEEAAHHKYEPKHPPGSARYTLGLTKARELWGLIAHTHHAVLRYRRHTSGAKAPEADALIDTLNRELELDLPYPDRGVVDPTEEDDAPSNQDPPPLEADAASDEVSVTGPTTDDCLRLLTRIEVPRGQRQLYRGLLVAGPEGATTQELISTMGRRDDKDLQGLLGALGHRVNGTEGYGATHNPGIGMILDVDEVKGRRGWRYRLKSVMRDALVIHAPPWLPNSVRLVAFVRSRFPGWLGFEDPRFNHGPLDEAGYKLATVRKADKQLSEPELRRLIDAEEYGEVIARLIEVGTDNNLLWNNQPQRGDLQLLHHDGLDRPAFCQAFFDLLYGSGATPVRLDQYVDWVSSQGLDSMNRWTLPTYFLFFLDHGNEIFVRPTSTRNFLKLGGWDIQFGTKPTGDDYARIRDAYRQLREELAAFGPRHMIDLHSFGWVAQEEAKRQWKAHQAARDQGVELDRNVEASMVAFERTVDARKLIDQANRIEQAKRSFAETFGNATKLRSLSPEAFVDFFNEVDSHGGSSGIFSLNVVFSNDPKTQASKHLDEDLPTLKEALKPLLRSTGTPAERIDATWGIGSGVRHYITEGLAVASALLFIQDPDKASGVLSMQKKEEKLRAAQHMPDVPQAATLGERFEAFEQVLTELPERYGRKWTPEARKEFYFTEAFMQLNRTKSPPTPSLSNTNGGWYSVLLHRLDEDGLLFSPEAIANYILALQAKRFAILTGISGTGKTRIAMAVARSFRATIRDRRAADPDAATVPEGAVRMTARPYNFKYRQIMLPMAFVAGIDHFLIPDENSNGGPITVSYPGGRAQLRFWQDPKPNRNATALLFGGAHDFRDWYSSNLEPDDHFYISSREGSRPGDHRLELSLTETKEAERDLDNYTVVPVRPDWVDNRGLLGYLNPITGRYSVTPFLSLLLEARDEEVRAAEDGRDPHPFFVVLDEMNLARVEHYFSDFLSALESGERIPLHESEEVEEGETESESDPVVPRQLRIPKNVFFTGTVNVDETTYMFSPKVLDRAFTIEFDQVDLKGYTDGEAPSQSGGLDLGADEVLALGSFEKPGRNDWVKFCELDGGRYGKILRRLHGVLEEEHRHFGYRVANEIARFVNLAHGQSAGDEATVRAAFDLALRQKVLPKFHGTQQELEPLLRRLFHFAVDGEDGSHGEADVSLNDWRVEHGRLKSTRRPKAAPDGSVPAGTPEASADETAAGGNGETEGSATTANADSAATEANANTGAGSESREPEFPRTAAKIWRMLKRLEQRGFAAFIE